MKKWLVVLLALSFSMPALGLAEDKPKEFMVYVDKNSRDNHFIPSGWMGDY